MQWSDEELNILVEEYGKVKIKDLSIKIGRSPSSIRWKAQELKIKADRNITNSKNKLNHSFFEVPNPLNCYIAGLIAADGYINTSKNLVCFYQKEKKLVEYIKTALKATNSIYYRRRKNTEEYSIQFCSTKLVKDLEVNFGIADNKSKIGLPVPNIHDLDLILCYIAGLIDGDGSISRRKYCTSGKLHLSFTLLCSKNILDWINHTTNSSLMMVKRNDCNVDLWKMYSSHLKAYLFLDMVYESLIKNGIYISNKFEKIKIYKMENNK